MNIIAFDLSLTSTGWSDGADCGLLVTKLTGVQRLRFIREQVLNLARGADLVVIEGFSYNSKMQRSVHEIGGLGWVVRLALSDAGIRWVDVPPASLKKFATGKGNAKKEMVFAAAIRKLEYGGTSFDEADALFLFHMARTHYAGSEVVGTIATVYEREALAGVEWPKIAQAVAA